MEFGDGGGGDKSFCYWKRCPHLLLFPGQLSLWVFGAFLPSIGRNFWTLF